MSRITVVFLGGAAFIAGAFVACELAGLRDATSVLSGTPAAGGDIGAALGLVYVAVWLAFVIICPILTLAGLLHLTLDVLTKRRARGRHAAPSVRRTTGVGPSDHLHPRGAGEGSGA